MGDRREKVAALLLAMGGPDSTEAIGEYLYNIFSDRSLIRLPGGALLQKPFAHLISFLRRAKVRDHYQQIGGSSPLLRWTQAQARHIESQLQGEFPGFRCYTGMRYYHPTIADTADQMRLDGCRHVVVIPMYPQYSAATTGSSVEELERSVGDHSQLSWTLVKDFHDAPGYIDLMRDYIGQHTSPDDVLLFSAHALPQRFVDEGDPYVDQVRRTSELAASGRKYYVSFQSRTGPVDWVGPDTIDEAKRLLSSTNERLCLIPVSFVCDHIETLYEIDIELRDKLGEAANDRLYRLPMFNDDQRFGDVLAQLVAKRIKDRAHV